MPALSIPQEVGMSGINSGPSVPPGVKVLVLGPAPADLVRALWTAGLRPVRGQTVGTLWMAPFGGDAR